MSDNFIIWDYPQLDDILKAATPKASPKPVPQEKPTETEKNDTEREKIHLMQQELQANIELTAKINQQLQEQLNYFHQELTPNIVALIKKITHKIILKEITIDIDAFNNIIENSKTLLVKENKMLEKS